MAPAWLKELGLPHRWTNVSGERCREADAPAKLRAVERRRR